MSLLKIRVFSLAAALFGAAALAAASAPSFLTPDRGEPLAPGSVVRVEWHYSCDSAAQARADEAELVLSLDGGLTYPVRVSRELDPCESNVIWRVPALPSDSARLALRIGGEMSEHSEEIEVVSAPFRILPDAEGRVQPMLQRANEWWTDPEPEMLDSDDLLGRSMRSAGHRLTSSADRAAFSLPSAAAALHRERGASGPSTSTLCGRRRSVSVPHAPPGAPTPLRL